MKNLKHHIFGKKDENGKKRYWMSVRTKVPNKEDEFVDAAMNLNLSKRAEEKFGQYARPTKNADVLMIRAEFTDAWLRAVQFKDGPGLVFFVNDFEIVADKSAPSW